MSSNSNERVSFASKKDQLEYPDFLEIQLKSFSEFFQLGTTPENRRREGLYPGLHGELPYYRYQEQLRARIPGLFN
jgi:hypothetical protein